MIAVLLPAAFKAWRKAGLMLGLCVLGPVAAVGMAGLFRGTLFVGERSLLRSGMPPYRLLSCVSRLQRNQVPSGYSADASGFVGAFSNDWRAR